MDKRSVIVGLAKKQYNHYGQCLLREDGTKAPTSNTRKGEMISWLKANKIPFNENWKKPEIYEIVMSKKPAPVYKIDEYLKKTRS
jgi:hypothetical protein